MAVPLTNITLAQIASETGLNPALANNIADVFDYGNDHIRQAYISRVYCPGGKDDLITSPYKIGYWRNYNVYGPSGYGWLYNYPAVIHSLELAPVGWRIPTKTDYENLIAFIELSHVSPGEHLKIVKTNSAYFHPYWDKDDNVSAFDTYGFMGTPNGRRTNSGEFLNLTYRMRLWTATSYNSTRAWYVELRTNNQFIIGQSIGGHKESGFGVRCIQNAPVGEPTGTTGTLTDFDNNVYGWVTIGALRWMSENLKTTKYRNGSVVPLVTDSSTWSGLSTGARCAYNNDAFYVYGT